MGSFWIGLIGVALAVPPSAEVVGDEIVARVSVAAPVAEARARVTDPQWITATEGDGSKTTLRGKEGDCLLFDSVSPSSIIEARYTTRHCPTPDGARGSLVSSNVFSAYTTSWRVVPEGQGSLVEYRTRMVMKLMLPQSWVYGTVRKRMEGLMQKVQARLGAP